MSVFYRDDSVTLLLGDAAQQLATLPPSSVDCLVTSPPYYTLRDFHAPAQYGRETTPAAYIEHLRHVFRVAQAALSRRGTLWLNLADGYIHGPARSRGYVPTIDDSQRPASPLGVSRLLDKSLIGLPWRVVLALQADGWKLLRTIIWHKPNALPDPVIDRLSRRHEYLFVFANGDRAHLNADLMARLGDVWTIPTRPYHGAHTAAFPLDIPLRAVCAGCPPGGLVCDPFSGSGTTGHVARALECRYIGIDINYRFHNEALHRMGMVRTQTRPGTDLVQCNTKHAHRPGVRS